ncbi:glycosyl transferase [Actinoplanes italicus]|uniref:L-2-deoxyfucosyltransferase n=1 Tax=Actinoplanes italicus TaxID=113567 RepID=A0A2T0K8P5_9ACTN|nr:nucleotide disphospho-sugar-binding domain-containing protein [Actinoplanes italicus]PRX19421.1 L-2-deoxyfucosyltransferase [Actinoplanes italicus]GIE30564.1 glycosyl transferase [Actinoplanes italicus]
MRVLFLTASAKTHLYGMVPLAWALRAAGHDVRVAAATDPSALTADDAARTGLPFVAVGQPVDLGAMARAGAAAGGPRPSSEVGANATQTDYVDRYLNGDPTGELELSATAFRFFCPPEATDDLSDLAVEWGADLIVWDYMMMFGGPAAARRSGAAHARFVYGVDAPVQLRVAWKGDGPDPLEAALTAASGHTFSEEMVLGQWAINNMPPWTWRPDGAEYVDVRPLPFNGPAVVPDWLRHAPDRPRVCLTLGLSTRDVASVGISFDDLFDAVSGLDMEVVATVAGDTADRPAVPDNVRLVEFVPMNALLPTCAAVLHHGGSQTVAAALEYGVPQLVLPSNFGNQRWWGPVAQAEALDKRGAGIHLGDADHLTPEGLRSHLVRIVGDPSFRAGAAVLRDELAVMPTPADAVPMLELLTERQRGG